MSPLGNNHPYPDKQCWHHSTKLSTIPSLRSKRFHVVSEQKPRNESQPLPSPLPLAKNGTPSIFHVAKTEIPLPIIPLSFFAPKPLGNVGYSGYKIA